MKKKILAAGAALLALGTLAACADGATVAEQNNKDAANNFEVDRRIVFFNGITDNYLLEIEGRCAFFDEGAKVDVMCKVGDKQYKKHSLGLSDNVSYFVEQVEPNEGSEHHYVVRFRPEEIIPDIKVDTSVGEVG